MDSNQEKLFIDTAISVITRVRESEVVYQDSERDRRVKVQKLLDDALVKLEQENAN